MSKLTRISAVCVFLVAGGWLATAATAEFPRRSAVVKVVEKVGPAVVNISTERIVRQPVFRRRGLFRSPFDDFFQRDYRMESLGSGVIIDPRGYVIMNEHVIRGSSRIMVALADGREFEVDLVGTDTRSDIAILKIRRNAEASAEFEYAAFGRSDDLMIGETVVAVGNPQGLNNTVTVGVISALERRIYVDRAEFPGLIQTDAAINPGSSGGPLLNINGELIGINMAMANAENIGFAVPVARVQRSFDEFVNGVISLYDSIGLEVLEIPPRLATRLGLEPRAGIITTAVVGGGYGERFGIQQGDVILEVDGNPVPTTSDYNRYLSEHAEGEPLSLKYWREGKTQEISFPVQMRFDVDDEQLERSWFGMTAVGITNRLAKELEAQRVKVDAGVLVYVVERGSPAWVAGIRPGDIVEAVGRKQISSIGDYQQARRLLEGYKSIEFQIRRGGWTNIVELKKDAI